MAQEIAFAAPRAEEMTRVVTGAVGAGVTGLVEGVMVKMAPSMGAAAPLLTWGTLLGAPLIGGFGALFTRGMLGDLCQGVLASGLGVVGYSLPELMKKATSKATSEVTSRVPFQANAGQGVKRIGVGQGVRRVTGPAGAPARAAAMASNQVRAGWVPEAIY